MKKTLLITTALLLGVSGVFADDFDDFGSFGDDGADSAASKLEVNGSVDTEIRAYVDTSDVEGKDGADKVEMDVTPSASIDLTYSGNKSDISLTLKIDEDTIKNHPEDVIDEAVLRGYFGNLTLEAGKMKVVWGKGDKLHVLDNFNADDYSDFIIPDYLDRRISTPMVRAVYSLPFANMNLEGVYTPLLPVDRFATEGRWTPAQVGALTGVVTGAATDMVAKAFKDYTTASGTATLAGLAYKTAGEAYQAAATAYLADPTDMTKAAAAATAKAAYEEAKAAYELATSNLTSAGTAYMLYLENANALSADPSVIYPDLWTLKYSQYGARVTATLGQVDLGLSYYNGWYKQPSFNASKLNTFLDAYLANGEVSEEDKFLAYDKKQTFGLEASSIIWHFNVRGEFAYNLTDDLDGTDPWVHNNSIAWLGGFDIDLPFWNANLNVQETGSFILHGDECDDFAVDVDYNSKGYTNNKLVCNITTSFLNDKLAPEVTIMYGIERGDLVVMSKLAFKPDQNLTLTASGMYMHCADEDSEFYSWRRNSFASLTASYQF